MGTDNIKHKAEEYTGAAKRKVGEATDNRDLQSEGTAQESKAKAKQVADDAVDKAREVKDDIAEKARDTFDRDNRSR